MTGSATIQFAGTTRARGDGEDVAVNVIVRVINPDNSWGPSQTFPIAGGVPSVTSAAFHGLVPADGYTAVAATLNADGGAIAAMTSAPFSVVEAQMTFVITSVSGSSS